MLKIKIFFVGIIISLAMGYGLWAMGVPLEAEESISERPIRVAVVRDAESVILSVRSSYNISSSTGKIVASGKGIYAKVTAADYGLKLGAQELKMPSIDVRAEEGLPVYINGMPYRARITISRDANKKLLVVNTLDIEEYLAGVLYEEVSHRWPIEVLKAQAIVARTFALYQANVNISRNYDLTSDTYSQVYGGSASERQKGNRAVALTKGLVLTYNNKILPAYYHATCGGATENADNLWKIDLPALKSVKCGWCDRSPHFRWRARLPLNEIKERLNKAGIAAGDIELISVAAHNTSGRVKEISVKTKEGERIVSAKDFRLALGPKILRSTKFEVSVDNFFKDALFDGLGWGHGVGLCQWGAYFMSRKGKKAEEILQFYYPGAEIKMANGK